MLRIAETAKLIGKLGNTGKRNELAGKATYAIAEEAHKLFKENGKLDSVEITNLFKKHAPNANIELSQLSEKGYFGFAGPKLNKDKTTIQSLIMELPFLKNGGKLTLSKEHFETFVHETRHIMDYLFNPKFSLLNIKLKPELKDIVSGKRFEQYENFFNKKLYQKVSNNFSLFKNDNYLDDLGTSLQKLFKEQKTSQEERIEVLKGFKFELLTEKNAYADEFSLASLSSNSKVPKTDPQNYFGFDEKIKMLNKLLAEELENARFENALMLENKKT